ncbi:MAG: hypothetical protein ABFS10_12230 [Bacteroidota bacterium]
MILKTKILLIILVFLSVNVKSQFKIREAMLADSDVQKELSSYLEKIPVGHESYFGFTNRNEIEEVKLGSPFQILTLDYESIDIESEAINRSILWYIPIILDDTYRCFLHVKLVNNSFIVVGIGLMELARDVDNFEKLHNFKQMQNKALFFDPTLNIICLVSDVDNYYPIRELPQCSDCDTANDQVYNRTAFLNRIRIYD